MRTNQKSKVSPIVEGLVRFPAFLLVALVAALISWVLETLFVFGVVVGSLAIEGVYEIWIALTNRRRMGWSRLLLAGLLLVSLGSAGTAWWFWTLAT